MQLRNYASKATLKQNRKVKKKNNVNNFAFIGDFLFINCRYKLNEMLVFFYELYMLIKI